jgi:hypothetical protein
MCHHIIGHKNSNGHHGNYALVACATFIEYMNDEKKNPYHIYCPHTYCCMQLHVMCNLSYVIMGSSSCMCRMHLKINCIQHLQITRFLLVSPYDVMIYLEILLSPLPNLFFFVFEMQILTTLSYS